jgi:hypothetical protein
MTNRRRLLLLIFLAAALVGLVLLSMSLSNLPLQPGRPFYLGEPEQVSPTPQGETEGPDFWALLHILFPLLVWIGVPLFIASIIWAIIRKKKAYLISVLIVLGWAALILYLQLNVMQNPQQSEQAPVVETQAQTTLTPTPTDIFDPTTPEWLVYATSVGLALLLLAIAWSFWQAWRRRPRPLELVAEEAETALGAIAAGTDWQNAIVRCYAEMCQALRKARGLARRQATTPHEFAVQLQEAGLPGEHIQRLTRLFEIVRYGGRQVRPEDEQEAVACLTAIVRFCRGEP